MLMNFVSKMPFFVHELNPLCFEQNMVLFTVPVIE